jgi:hypothetical protein
MVKRRKNNNQAEVVLKVPRRAKYTGLMGFPVS